MALFNQGRYAESEALARKLAGRFPHHGFGWKVLGATLQLQGRSAEALEPMRKAAALLPRDDRAQSNLGAVLGDLNRLRESEACHRRALAINPDSAAAHDNLGNTLQKQRRFAEAEASYRRALAIRPDAAGTHNNLGVTLMQQDRLAEAEAGFRRALEIAPDHVEALDNLAGLLAIRGEATAALDTVLRSLRAGGGRKTRNLFVHCVKRMRFAHADEAIRETLIRALTEPWGRPADLARAGAEIVGFDRNDRLLRCLLVSAPIHGIELERFLTLARHALLEAATGATSSGGGEEDLLGFHGALARQCFINEYVFAWTDDEADLAHALRASLVAALEAGTPIPALWPVAVAAYFPLHSLPFADRLLDRPWPDAVAAVLAQQVIEPREERQNRAAIARLTAIEDGVSRQVRNQYEESPYPRWVRAEPADAPEAIDDFLRGNFPLADFRPLGKDGGLDVLVAGCGTGQHPIGTAQRFRGARVLAVDLSLTSLCYAMRKTRELGLATIEYAQADILKLGALDRRFDVIESCGVLHHLADPMAGWRVLLSLLRPGGLMRVGLYSEAARQDVVRARDFIAARGDGSTAEDIRRCRQALMDAAESARIGSVLDSGDFFSVSQCRDLLFHVQEHRMALAGIAGFLRDNGLRFLGFEIGAHVLRAYGRRFPDDPAATDLGHWEAFENDHPETFSGMYQFWIQKAPGPQTSATGHRPA